MLQALGKTPFQSHCKRLHRLLALAILTIASANLHAENRLPDASISDLDSQTAAISNLATDALAQHALSTYVELDDLLEAVQKRDRAGDTRAAVTLLKTHLALVKNNIDNKAMFSFISILLKFNDRKTAEELYQQATNEADKSLVSYISYLFAKYYLARNNWTQTIALLKDIIIDLPENDANYAYLMHGIALQHLKKHRDAVQYYEKISKTSQYYAYGQLNLALAYIRQNWWTDAHLIIKNVINDKSIIKSEEFVNRLYLVLGYSLLQQDYFRDSRNAFRHISQDSQYANRALLGISLTAASQNDYIGSLNLLSILKNKSSLDLSVDESYLIIPYVYSNLKQYLTASASYTEALTYYQGRIDAIALLLNEHAAFQAKDMNDPKGIFIIKNNVIDLSEQYPESFFDNLRIAESLAEADISGSLKTKITALNQHAQKMLNEMIDDALKTRKDNLNSYLNQARYGLARMYDTNQSPDK